MAVNPAQDAAKDPNYENDASGLSCKDLENRFLEAKNELDEQLVKAENEQIKAIIRQKAFGILDGMKRILRRECRGKDRVTYYSRTLPSPHLQKDTAIKCFHFSLPFIQPAKNTPTSCQRNSRQFWSFFFLLVCLFDNSLVHCWGAI